MQFVTGIRKSIIFDIEAPVFDTRLLVLVPGDSLGQSSNLRVGLTHLLLVLEVLLLSGDDLLKSAIFSLLV